MIKGGFQAMRAVEDFLAEKDIAHIEGWIASGASKRGWISWLYGAVS
jgi:PhoPQ-activated pathogenicity-related protein